MWPLVLYCNSVSVVPWGFEFMAIHISLNTWWKLTILQLPWKGCVKEVFLLMDSKNRIYLIFRCYYYRKIWPANKLVDPGCQHEWTPPSVWCRCNWGQIVHSRRKRWTKNIEHGRVLWPKEEIMEPDASYVHTQTWPRGGGTGGTNVCGGRTRRVVLLEHGWAVGPTGQTVELCGPYVNIKEHSWSSCATGKVCWLITSTHNSADISECKMWYCVSVLNYFDVS